MTRALAPAPADAFTVPDYVEPVEAWRVWRVGRHDGRFVLRSAYSDEPWEPGVPLSATCVKQRTAPRRPWRMGNQQHAAPDITCSCGIYGVRSAAAARWFLERQAVFGRADRVIGRVALWGDVVVSQWGWRASLAYPLELLVPAPRLLQRGLTRRPTRELEEILDALEAYRVPVDVFQPGAALAV